MKILPGALLALLCLSAIPGLAQVAPRDINAARNAAGQGTTLDTNVTFSLRMTLAGDDTLRETAALGQDVSIHTVIRPETGDIGKPADVVIVDLLPPVPFMRNGDGDFVVWDGNPRNLVPFLEGVTLTDELDVEVFSGQLGNTGNHRIYVGFVVDGALYFTPSALKISITEPVPTAREQAISLFESTISPRIVQARCITCHVSGGQADGLATHLFVRTSNPDHLDINFGQLENLHGLRGSDFILSKVRGGSGHIGGVQLLMGSQDYNSLSDFLALLDEASP